MNIISLLIETIKSLKNVNSMLELKILTVLRPSILTVLYFTLKFILPVLGLLVLKIWKCLIFIYILKSCAITSDCSYISLIFFPTAFCVPVLEPGIILAKIFLDVAAEAHMFTVLD